MKNSTLGFLGSALAALLVGLSGCVPYEVSYPGKLALHTEKPGYQFASVEFGEQGNLRDPTQVAVARQALAGLRKPLLVVFVHGWHNNATTAIASSETEPPHHFSQLLDALSQSPSIRKEGWQVFGVYLAWRGKMYNDVAAEYATTFWNRYDAGRNLGTSVACRGVISDLVAQARKRGPQNSRTFLIGHSFGGLVLEQAISDSVSGAMRDGAAVAPADLTLFLNSASDSEMTRGIIERLSNTVKVGGWDKTRDFPIFASLTSETDSATGTLFPLGKSLASIGKHFDSFPVREGEAPVSGQYFFTHTPGHNTYLLSHATSAPESVPAQPGSAFEANLRAVVDPARPLFLTRSKKGDWSRWRIERVGTTTTPYWVVKVSQPIMDGHNDIFNDNALALMATLYRLNHRFTQETHLTPTLRPTGASEVRVELQSGPKADARATSTMHTPATQTSSAEKAAPRAAPIPVAPALPHGAPVPPPAGTPGPAKPSGSLRGSG